MPEPFTGYKEPPEQVIESIREDLFGEGSNVSGLTITKHNQIAKKIAKKIGSGFHNPDAYMKFLEFLTDPDPKKPKGSAACRTRQETIKAIYRRVIDQHFNAGVPAPHRPFLGIINRTLEKEPERPPLIFALFFAQHVLRRNPTFYPDFKDALERFIERSDSPDMYPNLKEHAENIVEKFSNITRLQGVTVTPESRTKTLEHGLTVIFGRISSVSNSNDKDLIEQFMGKQVRIVQQNSSANIDEDNIDEDKPTDQIDAEDSDSQSSGSDENGGREEENEEEAQPIELNDVIIIRGDNDDKHGEFLELTEITA